jgi:moderate conductance mechanosensitive channel
MEQAILKLSQLWQQLLDPEKLQELLAIIITVIVVWIISKIILRASKRLIEKALIPHESVINYQQKISRANTLIPFFYTILKFIVLFIAVTIVLRKIEIDTTPIIASAGVLGLAIGFGAQAIVKDFISGIFILLDGTISVGDVITTDSHTGTVESMNLRHIQLRKFSGELWTIRNGQIGNFGNYNKEWTRAMVEVDIAYEQDIEKGMKELEAIGQQWAEKNKDIILEPPVVQGVLSLGASGITIRLIAKLKPMMHWGAERELKLLIKNHFDSQGVEIPFNRQVVYLRKEEA